MLAANDRTVTPDDLHLLQYPIWGTPKKDGIRARMVYNKQRKRHEALSRTNIPIPNYLIEEWVADNEVPEGCDGELVVQDRFGDADFHECQSKILSQYSVPFAWKYYVFDAWNIDAGYRKRYKSIELLLSWSGIPYIQGLRPVKLHNEDEVLAYEKEQVEIHGHEGIILRSADGHYKQGRTTFLEGLMLKMKRMSDHEALIIGFHEKKHNANSATRDKVGRLKRSKNKANLHGTGMLGAFHVRDIVTGEEFKVSGFTDAFARHVWENKHHYFEKICTYCKVIHGEKNKPRQPKFKGIRNLTDL